MIKSFELTPLEESHLEMILEWRNMPIVRQNMYTSHEITLDEHKRWFANLTNDDSRAYFIAIINGILCGVIGFSEINRVKGIATWAFYTSPNAIKGSGSLMEFYALDYAFNQLNLHKLRCEVLGFNKTVIKLHTKFGFSIEGEHRDAFYDGNDYHNIIHLGIFAGEWVEQRIVMKKKLRIEQ